MTLTTHNYPIPFCLIGTGEYAAEIWYKTYIGLLASLLGAMPLDAFGDYVSQAFVTLADFQTLPRPSQNW